jgi:isopentenyl-diphosphate delta-isomerase
MKELKVILVDEEDNITGESEKMKAHQEGLLHRAFSIFIFNQKGEMLLQQRAMEKYHSGGLWSNACCSHPKPGEETSNAAARRLREEMGIETELQKLFSFIYKTEFGNGLTEHEFDHVFAGVYEGAIKESADEVIGYRYMEMRQIRQSLEQTPEQYTAWFHLAFPKIEEWWSKRYNTEAA